MPGLTNHGGGCCGMRHIHGFYATGADNIRNDIATLDSLLRRQIDNQKCVEIVLNQYQIDSIEMRPTLDKMAQLGFVLVGVYLNSGSDTNNYVFHRAQTRRPLTTIGDAWTGQYMTPGLSGILPSNRSTDREWDVEHRHDNPDFELPLPRFREPAPASPPPAPAPVRVVCSGTYHNVYRGGRIGAGHDTLEACRAGRRTPGQIGRKLIIWNGSAAVEEWAIVEG